LYGFNFIQLLHPGAFCCGTIQQHKCPATAGTNAQCIFFCPAQKKYSTNFFVLLKMFKIYAKLHPVEKQGIKLPNGKGVYGFSTPYVQF